MLPNRLYGYSLGLEAPGKGSSFGSRYDVTWWLKSNEAKQSSRLLML